MRTIALPLVLALLALVACTKSKAASGEKCTQKADCADGMDCYIIGIDFKCYTKEQGEAACKASVGCKSGGKCRATQDSTHVGAGGKPEYMMGGCE
jgi:hypothetical protein